MRQYHNAAARPSPADRNQVTSANQYVGVNIAPHAPTQRVIYTVPAAKRTLVAFASCEMLRITAAAPVGLYQSFARVITIAVGNGRMINLQSLDNNVGARAQNNIGQNITLLPTETLDLITGDAGTGGTVNYAVSYGAQEYDA